MSNKQTASLGTRLSIQLALTVLVVMGVVMGVVSQSVWQGNQAQSRAYVQQAAQQGLGLIKTFEESASAQATKEFALFYQQWSGTFAQPAPGELTHEGRALNGNFDAVDQFNRTTGGSVATVFARQGDDFKRITTSLTKEDGSRAIGTLLDRNHPAYALMLKGEPFMGRATLFGRSYMTVYEPIKVGDQVVGILFTGSDIGPLLKKLNSLTDNTQLFETGKLMTVTSDAMANEAWAAQLKQVGDQGGAVMGSRAKPDDGQAQWAVALPFEPWKLTVVAMAPEAEMMANAKHSMMWLWGGAGVTLVLVLVMVTTLTRSLVVGPINQLKEGLMRLSGGNLSQPVTLNRRDELGALAQAMEEFRQRLGQSLGTVRASANAVSDAATEIAAGNQDLSQRTEMQASAVQMSASNMDQLAGTVRHNADNAQHANQLATRASEVATRGGDVVTQVVHTMRDIHQSSQKIADIISVIDGIAFQTNILALNAAVEAARAGEQGRGFAVVAGEVRSLAQRSAEAAKEIKNLIDASVQRVNLGTQQVDEAGRTMEDVVAAIRRVSDIVGEISAASVEQSSGVVQIGSHMTQLDQGTQQNAALVEQMAAAASSLRHQAGQMVDAVASFQLGDGAVSLRSFSSSASAPSRAVSHAPSEAPRPAAKPTLAAPKSAQAPASARLGSSAVPAAAKPASKPVAKPAASLNKPAQLSAPKVAAKPASPATPPATAASAPKAAAKAAPAPKPASKPAPIASASDDLGDWESF